MWQGGSAAGRVVVGQELHRVHLDEGSASTISPEVLVISLSGYSPEDRPSPSLKGTTMPTEEYCSFLSLCCPDLFSVINA